MEPVVFAVVLNHNGENWLRRCLESLLSDPYPRLQVVLVDNGSSDGSLPLARSISSRIEILANPVNLGFSKANNAAAEYALQQGADYIALLNNDMYFEPGWLGQLVQVGEQNPQLGILGPAHLAFDGEELNSWMTSAYPQFLDRLRQPAQPGNWLPVDWVEGSCLVAKRRVFERIGLLDPIFFAFFEECDFCRRARAAGFQVALVPSSRVHHHRGGSWQTHATRRRALMMTQSSMIYNSTDPQASLIRNFAALLRNDATHLKDAVFGNGHLGVWCRANCAVLARLPRLYRKWRSDRATLHQAGAPPYVSTSLPRSS